MYSLRAILIAVLALSLSPRGLTATEPQVGKVRLVHSLRNPDLVLADRVFSTDGRLLIVKNNHDGSHSVYVWDPKAGKVIARCSLGNQSAYNITFSPDGKTVACSYHMAKEICLFDVPSGKLISRIAQPGYVSRARFAPDGSTLTSLSNGMRLWDVKTGKELWRLQLQLPEKSLYQLRERWESCYTLAFSPDGKVLAVALEDGSIHLCDMKTGREIRRLFRAVANPIPSQLAFSPDGRYLAASAEENIKEKNLEGEERSGFVIRLWDVRSGQLVRTFQQFRPPLSPKDRLNFRVAEQHYAKYGRPSAGLAFSPDGKTVANCGWVMQLWEVATGRLRHEFDANTSGWSGFSPDGRLYAAGCATVKSQLVESEGIRLWDWRDPCLKQPSNLDPRDIERLWSDLASEDATVGYRAIATLLANPGAAVAALKGRLQRIEPVTSGELDRLIVNLDNESFAVRERATERLAALGEVVRPALLRVKVQRPSLEVRRRIESLLPRLSPALHFPRKSYSYTAKRSSCSANSRNLCLFGRPPKPAWIS